jgi:hypothetical protein
MSRLSIYYGRIRYLEPHPGQESFLVREFPIREAVEAARSVERYRHQWVLGNLVFDDDGRLIMGRLGYPETGHRTQQDYDPVDQRFVDKTYELPDAASAAFVLNYETGAIAFEVGNKIRPTGFINHFVALLNSSGRGAFKGELVRVAENYREFIGNVDRVTRVAFEVRPTNPRDRAIFRPLDEGMKAANAKLERVLIENDDEGLIVDPPPTRDDPSPNPAVQGIEMVEEGYGERYRIDAERDGRPLRYDSKSGGLLRDVLEDAPDDPDTRTRTLIDRLEQRAGLLQPGHEPAPPLEASGNDFEDDDEEDAEDEVPAEWPEDE